MSRACWWLLWLSAGVIGCPQLVDDELVIEEPEPVAGGAQAGTASAAGEGGEGGAASAPAH